MIHTKFCYLLISILIASSTQSANKPDFPVKYRSPPHHNQPYGHTTQVFIMSMLVSAIIGVMFAANIQPFKSNRIPNLWKRRNRINRHDNAKTQDQVYQKIFDDDQTQIE